MPTRHFAPRGAWAAACLAALSVGYLSLGALQPAAAESAVPGSIVEIDEYFYSYYLGGDGWELECRYRVDGGQWQSAFASGDGSERRLRLPGTSVEGAVVGHLVEWTCDEDVTRMWIGTRRVR